MRPKGGTYSMSKNFKKGENHWKSKLDESKVKAIRTASVYVTNAELAVLFGISRAQVGLVRRKLAWKHIA